MYEPTPLVKELAASVGGEPIAHGIAPNGDIVIVMRDGRKLRFPNEPKPAKRAKRKP